MTPDRTPMSALCVCGYRLGLHRVGDHACLNPHWRPGNGKAQWRKVAFLQANTERRAA